MFRCILLWLFASECFPRIRGDVPKNLPTPPKYSTFSPHTRGCSVAICATKSPLEVFPAYAGMFLKSAKPPAVIPCFPRIRGDVPAYSQWLKARQRFSPHTRGCSAVTPIIPTIIEVFPAYAGMFRLDYDRVGCYFRFPRIRGDVPEEQRMPVDGVVVFPAYAGMFPPGGALERHGQRFPRIRGDVPLAWEKWGRKNGFSPHTRGCSGAGAAYLHVMHVFPAYAGMFLKFGNRNL